MIVNIEEYFAKNLINLSLSLPSELKFIFCKRIRKIRKEEKKYLNE